MAFTSSVLTLERHGAVATLWLDRPEQRNAMGRAFWEDLPHAAAAVRAERDLRVLVIAAKGPHFTVGLDLKEMAGGLMGNGDAASPASRNAARYEAVRTMQDAVNSIADLPIPVIAAVHGYCIGGGVDLTTACDIRLAAPSATFSVRETKVAIVADLGTLQRLPRIIGAGHVAELAYTGMDIDAERAAAIGLVNRVADDVLAAAYELAEQIAANSPLAVQGTKAVLAANDGRTVAEGLEFVATWNTLYLRSDDLTEAMTAFIERRPPTFTGS
ncbi:MAG: crotonase/enoyl-CoA hydratase family protein [Actinomycetales bacterium]|nr:crotonase/enoyl-CoA hydratase family protein [Actinomycetales bacterium]